MVQQSSCELILAYIVSMSSSKIILFIAALMFFMISINLLIITPCVFNYIIIPGIEKKVGKKLQFSINWDYFLFGNFFFRCIEIVNYIVSRYVSFRIKMNLDDKKYNRTSALARINYDIRVASKFEIIMSFFVMVNIILGIIDFAVLLLLPK